MTTEETTRPETVQFDVDSLTFDEFVTIEDETGEPWQKFVQTWLDVQRSPEKPVPARSLMLATWLMLRRTDSAVTLDEVRHMAFTAVWG